MALLAAELAKEDGFKDTDGGAAFSLVFLLYKNLFLSSPALHQADYTGYCYSLDVRPAQRLHFLPSRTTSCRKSASNGGEMRKSAVACLFAFLMVSCGGGSSAPPPPPPPPPPSITVSPTSATVALQTGKLFTAADSTGAPVAANWSLSSPTGTIQPNGSTATYSAPTSFPSPNTVTVMAALQSNPTKIASANITIVYPSNNANLQAFPIKLGTSGGNANDLGTKVCCIGTLGSLIQRGTTKFILSNNHVLARSGQGVAGEAINQPGQLPCFPVENTVANLTEAAALKPASGTSGPAPSNVDAAIAQIVLLTVDTSGTILELGAA